jgi:hypothetical protein
MTWAEEVTPWLDGQRRVGRSFEEAWRRLMADFPPDWRRDFGIRGHWYLEGTMDALAEEMRTEAWLRAVFERAWLNADRTRLRHLVLVEPVRGVRSRSLAA